ncbi:MAG: thioredoxin family protein [Lentisphaeria bacterium]|nr:thioredoxin family protein [Lentisphaeria bacterium]
MKKFLLVMFAALCCAVTSFAADECPKGWTLDIDAALKKAKAENKKVYLLFTGSDWCGYCIRLKNDVFSKKDFKKIAQNSLVPVYFDFPHKKEISPAQMKIQLQWAKKFGVRGYPTAVILDANGNKIGEIGGYRPAKAYINELKKFTGNKNGKKK